MSQYTVKQGDTLWSIAEKLLGDGNKYSEIQRANNLRGDAIYPGQVLTIPGRGHSTTTHRTTKHDATKHDATKHGTTKHGATSDDSSDDTTLISKDEFDKALTSNDYPKQRQKYDHFIQSCEDGKIKTKSEAAMYLATLLHESDGLRVTEEYHNSASISEYGNKYIGRGYIQLSSIENYRAASKYFKEDYVENPEKVKNDPHAWNVSAWYWQDQVHQYVKSGFRAVVKDGIRPLQPHWERREKIYGNVCKAFNVS